MKFKAAKLKLVMFYKFQMGIYNYAVTLNIVPQVVSTLLIQKGDWVHFAFNHEMQFVTSIEINCFLKFILFFHT